MQDKQVPCRIAGCEHTWTWFAAQQIRGFGQPPPDRMCDEHLAQFNELADREVQCRTPGCANTWTWKRGAQLAEMQRTGKLRRPSRLCAACFSAERETQDAELHCKIEGCRRTWTWTRDAQLRHRLWLLRQRSKADAAAARAAAAQQARAAASVAASSSVAVAAPGSFPEELRSPEAFADTLAEGRVPDDVVASEESTVVAAKESGSHADAEEPANSTEPTNSNEPANSTEPADEPGGDRRKRRRKRRRGGKPVVNAEGPPERMCGLCAQKLTRLQPREQPCKVHGCTRTWTWDRASQMRAWVASGSDDLDFEPGTPRRMCEVCREFCRTHSDREVACGRPECNNTWTFKTGAQLQAFLAGRTADPLKLCAECAKGEFAVSFRPGAEGGAVPEGAETMPCVVPGCEGTWLYIPGMRLRETPYGELAADRMCGAHRQERGFAVDPVAEVPEVEVTAADLEAEEAEDDDHGDEHEADAEAHDDVGDLAADAAAASHDGADEADEADEADAADAADAAGEPADADVPS